jgi:HK97 family phage major capsid protein
MFADITEEDARAKGYIKGKLKKEEVFSLLKRSTSPTTVYKKQKMDRDDVVDITDFDVVAWIKKEMRMMLDEELARAYLVGDGRLNSSDDKISEDHIRPIWKDEDLYTIKKKVTIKANATPDEKVKAFIRGVVKSRKDYKGSGEPTMFTTEDMLTDCLLLEDSTGRIIYETVDKLKSALRVKEIVTVPVMEGLKRTDSEDGELELGAIVVNLKDYNVGADKGGAINMFDDFDIDYNQMKYLIETRCSGALVKPYSAIAVEFKVEA